MCAERHWCKVGNCQSTTNRSQVSVHVIDSHGNPHIFPRKLCIYIYIYYLRACRWVRALFIHISYLISWSVIATLLRFHPIWSVLLIFVKCRKAAVGSVKVRLNQKSGRNRVARRIESRPRNWPSLLSYAVDLSCRRFYARLAESLIFSWIYLIIARLTTSSFTSKGIECRWFPDASTPFLHFLPALPLATKEVWLIGPALLFSDHADERRARGILSLPILTVPLPDSRNWYISQRMNDRYA